MTTTDPLTTLKICFHIPQSQALLLEMFMVNATVTPEEMVAANVAMSVPHARVLAWRVRGMLEKRGIKLESGRKVGYWLAPAAKKQVEDEIERYETGESRADSTFEGNSAAETAAVGSAQGASEGGNHER